MALKQWRKKTEKKWKTKLIFLTLCKKATTLGGCFTEIVFEGLDHLNVMYCHFSCTYFFFGVLYSAKQLFMQVHFF